jgi:iron complex outermembrane receptor protein
VSRLVQSKSLASSASALAIGLACAASPQPTSAQSTNELPPLVVEGQTAKKPTKKAAAKAKPAAATQAAMPQPTSEQAPSSGEKAGGSVNGYVAKQTATGTKTDTPIAEIPQSIAVVPKDQIEDQKAQSVAEALRYTPGVFTDYRGASNLKDEMFVRGFYYVPRYLDGLYLAGDLSYAKIDPYLLERIELLSGPSSVLYGQGNPGGIVNMVSKKPTDVPFHEVQLTFGSDKQLGLAFDVSDKIAGSKDLSYRVVGTGFGRDLQEDFAEQRSFAIAPSVTWKPGDNTELTVLGGYQNEPKAGFRNFLEKSGSITSIPGYGYVPRDFFVSDPNYEHAEREQFWIGYEFEHAFSNAFSIRQNARYHQVDWEHRTLVWDWINPSGGNTTVVDRMASGGTESWETVTVDNQAQFNFSTGFAKHTVLAGVDYLHRTREYQWGRNFGVPSIDLQNPIYGYNFSSLVLNPSNDEELTASQTGIYLQDQIKIGRLDLTGGVRHDWASTDFDNKLANSKQSYDDTAWTWRVGALYTFDNGIAPYVSYATSFDPSLYTPPAGQSAFDPTTAKQYEFGVKYAPKGTNTLLTAAYYDLTQEGVVMGQWSGGQTVYRQIGEIHNKGVELSARTDLTQNLSLIASYSHIDSKVIDSVYTNEVGKTPARIPENQAAIWGKYRFSGGFLRGSSIGAGARYIGQSWGDGGNTFEVPDVTLFDAMASYDFGALDPAWNGVDLQVNVKNIADETYVSSCNSTYACFYGEGRVVTGTLSYKW